MTPRTPFFGSKFSQIPVSLTYPSFVSVEPSACPSRVPPFRRVLSSAPRTESCACHSVHVRCTVFLFPTPSFRPRRERTRGPLRGGGNAFLGFRYRQEDPTVLRQPKEVLVVLRGPVRRVGNRAQAERSVVNRGVRGDESVVRNAALHRPWAPSFIASNQRQCMQASPATQWFPFSIPPRFYGYKVRCP
jgi:hypothetical protein